MSSKTKKVFKIIGISLLSIIGLLLIGICIVIWLVFTPARITPIVRTNLDSFLTCETHIERVELTFFSTFPNFTLQLDNFHAINPMEDAENDTLIKANQLNVAIDIRAFLRGNKVIVSDVRLLNPTAYIFTDNLGNSNYMVFKQDTSDTSSSTINYIELNRIELNNGNLQYVDLQNKINASALGLNSDLIFSMQGDDIEVNINFLRTDSISFMLSDSTEIKLESKEIDLDADVKIFPDFLTAKAKISTPNLFFAMNQEPYLLNQNVSLNTDVNYSFLNGDIFVNSLLAQISTLFLNTEGTIHNDSVQNGYAIGLNYKIDIDSISDILRLVPPAYGSLIKGIDAEGKIILTGKISGDYNNNSMPLISGDLELNKGEFSTADLPTMPIKNASAKIHYNVNLNQESETKINIQNLKVHTLNSDITAKGDVNQLFTDPRFAGTITANLDLPSISKEFLEKTGYSAEGKADLQASVKTTLNQAMNADLEKMMLEGSVELSDFSAKSKPDTLYVRSPKTKIDFSTNNKSAKSEPIFLVADISTTDFFASVGKSIKAQLNNTVLHVSSSDFLDTTKMPTINCTYDIAALDAVIDDMSVQLKNLKGTAGMKETKRGKKPSYQINAKTEDAFAKMADNKIFTKKLEAKLNVIENVNESDVLLQWMPIGMLSITDATVNTPSIEKTIQVPAIEIELKPNSYTISKSKLIIDKSDFSLEGSFSNLRPYLKGNGVLKGEFSFTSDFTDLNTITQMTSADMGSEETVDDQDKIPASDNPFMVPLNMNISLNTNIKKAQYDNILMNNIYGTVNVVDGKLILDGLKVDMPACKVQLTAMYRTPRKNHLYLGFDYHMLNVEIKDLLGMLPDLDTIMPMLRSFDGKAEFHVTAETYLNSKYDLKKSTLRGTAAISGQDLVLMDGETFSEIAKLLRFSKNARNNVDSLSTEFTLYKNEVDVYPFSIVMDKYRAVVSGQHNLDMSFNYHIAVVQSPIPFRLCVNVTGTLDDIKVKLAKCKYLDSYRPAKQNRIAAEQLNLKNMIREALIGNVNREE